MIFSNQPLTFQHSENTIEIMCSVVCPPESGGRSPEYGESLAQGDHGDRDLAGHETDGHQTDGDRRGGVVVRQLDASHDVIQIGTVEVLDAVHVGSSHAP